MTLQRRLLLSVPFLLLAAGCAGVPYEHGTPLNDGALAAALRSRLCAPLPAGMRDLHRGIVTIRGQQFAFSLYVLVRAPGDLRCIGIDDFGSVLFDVYRRHDQSEATVVRSDRGIPRSWLRDCVMRDLALHYTPMPSESATAVAHPDGTLGLVETLPHGLTREFLFEQATQRPTGCALAYGNRCVYRRSAGPAGQSDNPIGQVFHIVDYESRYVMDLELRESKPLPLQDKMFQSEAPGTH